MQRATPSIKKRRLNENDAGAIGAGASTRRNNRNLDSPIGESPIVFLNVGGKKIDVRRSLLEALRNASVAAPSKPSGTVYGHGGSRNAGGGCGNPLCEIMLNNHWSQSPTTTTDADGTVRIYLDRNPGRFEDLLAYVEDGKLFLKEIVNDDGRLARLREEGEFFTLDGLCSNIDSVLFGEPTSFRAGKWVKIAAQCRPGTCAWNWEILSGNKSLVSKNVKSTPWPPATCFEVTETGTYLVFFSLHSTVTKALGPSEGYYSETTDEFDRLCLYRNALNGLDGCPIPIVRCGAFDHRPYNERQTLLPFTASCAEPISLVRGNLLYLGHSNASTDRNTRSNIIRRLAAEKFPPQSVNYITLVQIFGSSMTKWNVVREKELKATPSIAKWTESNNDFPISTFSHKPLLADDGTKIHFKKAGYYLLFGRIATSVKQNLEEHKHLKHHHSTTQLHLCTKGGVPLHIMKDLVSYNERNSEIYNEKLVDYGSINDVVYVEENSYICVKNTLGSFVARHGTGSAPDPFGKIPTQGLSALRLPLSVKVDRYQITIIDDEVYFERVLGPIHGEEGNAEQMPLFLPPETYDDESEAEYQGFLQAADGIPSCHCMVIGSLSPLLQSPHSSISLLHNGEEIVRSQLSKGGGGKHCFNDIIILKQNDRIQFTDAFTGDDTNIRSNGQLAFIVLDS